MNGKKKWKVVEKFPEEFKTKFPEMDDVILQLLWDRKLKTQEEVDEFLNPDYSQDIHDPFLLKDMKRAVDRIKKAIENKEKIVVYGDYDADGVCSSVILFEAIKRAGIEPDVFLPHREIDGYGLNMKRVEEFAVENKLMITCDCGISNAKEVERANELGMDVIITDHHTVPENVPPAYAIIHPKHPREKYPWKDLAGAGVAFKLAQGLLPEEENASFIKWLLDLVAVASIADIVPLLGETRTITKYGLLVLNKTRRLGFKKLMEVASLKPGLLDTHSVGFMIAPRINAAGRMNHASAAYKLLISESEEDADALATKINQENSERQKIAEKMCMEAKHQIVEEKREKDSALFAFQEDWSPALVGLVASRLSDWFYRPSIVMAKKGDEIIGSGRSIEEINLIATLEEIPQFFKKFGGHPGACGFTLKGPEVLEDFKQTFISAIAKKLEGLELTPKVTIHKEIELKQVDWSLYDKLKAFEPFGEKNPRPLFLIKKAEVVGMDAIGKDGKHLRMSITQNGASPQKMIGFFFGKWASRLKLGGFIDIIFEVGVNEWNGNRELQLKIIDLKEHE
ncbi:MAG: single-stranded-DNA-specific exonuclease RecJ [Parcubacteria group bacterium]|nr:single-stranded-DNA-specific exonuclease RecJ [Parcubacteria group bacterium]